MKVQKVVSLADYERLIEKCRKYRKAIKDQQKATLAWKARALEASSRLRGSREIRPDLKAVS